MAHFPESHFACSGIGLSLKVSRMRLLVAFLVVCAAVSADGAELPAHQRIDQFIAQRSKGFDKLVAAKCNDVEFLRRITLDLTGRLPEASQIRQFLKDKSGEKRRLTIDRLLKSPEYARHMTHVFDAVLMQRMTSSVVSPKSWQSFLRRSFAENKSWDKITREILSADGVDAKKRAAARFYLDREAKVEPLTRQIGRIFLGADLECAQCHNHPEVDDYLQVNYYGISAFLVRSFVFSKGKKGRKVMAEKAVGEVSFRSVFERNVKGTKTTLPILFGGKVIKEPKLKKNQHYIVKPAKNVRPVPRFSRRAKLADAVINAGGNRFARTLVNRVWAQLLGRGIIEPIDLDHKGNPGSHPKLLAFLADQFKQKKYDIRWLVREIVLSKTYQRSSQHKQQPPEESYAKGKLKPLLPEQLAWAILDATGAAAAQRKKLANKANEDTVYRALAPQAAKIVKAIAHRPGKIPRGFNSQVGHALFLMNSPIIGDLVSARPGNLAAELTKMKDTKTLAESVYLKTLSRLPTNDEIAVVSDFVKQAKGKARQTALEELIWVLITSPEFRFNH